MTSTLELFPMGHVALAARSWRRRGRSLLTVIVKGTFQIHPEATMALAAPAPIVVEERTFQNNPVASTLRASDLALVVPKPELMLVGAAFAGPGRRVPTTTVRFMVQRGPSVLVDKQLEVIGDRRAAPGAPPPEPVPFDRMPLQYERAFGGHLHRDNPVGRGMTPDADGLVSHPNVALPQSGGVVPAGFGPIPSVWPARTQLRGRLGSRAANVELDVDVPDDFDETYFQAAPSDQRVAELAGGELITLVRLHPEIETLRTYLPTFRGAVLLQNVRGDRVPVPMRIDMVHLEPTAMRAEVVYRGTLSVAAEQLAQLRIAGALETPDRPFTFPDLASLRAQRPSVPPSSANTAPGAVPAAPSAPGAQPHPLTGTVALSGTVALADPGPVPPGPPLQSTVSGGAPAPKALPFAPGKKKRSGELPAVVAEKAATPWSKDHKPAPVITATGITSTMLADDADEPAAVAAPPPAPPPPAAPPPDEAPAAGLPKWREDPPAAPVQTAATNPKRVTLSRANLKGSLYKKAKR